MKWVLVSPELTEQRGRPVYLYLIVCDKKGKPQSAAITEDLSEAATFDTKRRALMSSAHKVSKFYPKRMVLRSLNLPN